MSSPPLVRLEGVCKRFGSTHVLRGCSLELSRGEVLVLCGPSGSGKSTLVRCINALESIDAGEVVVDGVQVHHPATDLNLLRRRVGMVFQQFELFPHLTVFQNLNLAQERVLRRRRGEAQARSEALLTQVGMLRHGGKRTCQLSGGEQQRVAIARALALDPAVMLFDEPTSSLDPEMVGEVLDVITSLARGGMSMIVVTHELQFARRVAHRIAFVDEGRIVEHAPAAQFFDRPRSARLRSFLARVIR